MDNPKTLEALWPPEKELSYPIAPYPRAGTTTNWSSTDMEDLYRANEIAGKPNLYGPNSITYAYNKWGFRCVEFDQIRSDYRVLSIGCSNVEGTGLPVEHTWPHLLCERIGQNNPEPVNLNLGVSGSSNRSLAIRTVRAMKMLQPTYTFIAWTFPARIQYVYADGELFDWWAPNEKELRSPDSKHVIKRAYFEKIQNDKQDLNNLMNDIVMVELAARLFGSNLCHSFLYLEEEVQDWLQPRVSGVFDSSRPIWSSPKARDLMHPGLEYNQWVTQKLYEWFENPWH